MKAMKNLIPLSNWILRITLILIIYSMYFKTFETFRFNNLDYFISLAMVIFAVLLLVGGFLKKDNLTVISGLVICLISILVIFIDGYSAKLLFNHLPSASIGLFFVAKGN